MEIQVDKYFKMSNMDEMKDKIFEDWKQALNILKKVVREAYRKAGTKIIHDRVKNGRTGIPLTKLELLLMQEMIPKKDVKIQITNCSDWNDFWKQCFLTQFKAKLEACINMKNKKKAKIEDVCQEMLFFKELEVKILDLMKKFDNKYFSKEFKPRWKNPEGEEGDEILRKRIAENKKKERVEERRNKK